MNLLFIIDKTTKLYLRDDFVFDSEKEEAVTVQPKGNVVPNLTHKWSSEPTEKEPNKGHWEIVAVPTVVDNRTYEQKLISLIRAKYSIDDEIALTNKGIADSTNAEYVAYRAYVSQCKQSLKA